MSARKVKPVFTDAQAKAVRVALRGALEDEWMSPGRVQSTVNALRELDSASWRAERKVKPAEGAERTQDTEVDRG